MKDMRFREMHALVDFMYKGEVNVTQDELPSLLKSAEALQIRGLCSAETANLASDLYNPRDCNLANDALLAQAHYSCTQNNSIPPKTYSNAAASTNGPTKKRKSEELDRPSTSAEVKEETVEEDGLYYGDIEQDHEFHQGEASGKPGCNLNQQSVFPYIRVKPESELFNNQLKCGNIFNKNIPNINPLNYNYTKYSNNYDDEPKTPDTSVVNSENDYYKLWLEQNGELEVSLLRASDKVRKPKVYAKNEVELIPKINTKPIEKTASSESNNVVVNAKMPIRRRGRPPIFKEKTAEITETVLKSDLDQFLEGKEVSSSGLSRKDLERVMMGKYNPNRRYSNEAMWAALMDVKRGGSIYRAAQTHKVPRKSLRNWMKRCQIKSSFPMPQQLKQFVENSKKQKEYRNFDGQQTNNTIATLEEEGFGKHFLMSNIVSSEDESSIKENDNKEQGDAKPLQNGPINMAVDNE